MTIENEVSDKREAAITSLFPEYSLSGFTAIDGSVAFYSQIASLVKETDTILDYGAGRAAWSNDPCKIRRELHLYKGKVKKVIGCDVDDAIKENRTVDEQLIMAPDSPLPLPDNSIDIIISDWTFEHIESPETVAAEFRRLLKPGGWICARTPNQYSYTSIATRLIKNRYHSKILKYAQPDRRVEDIFPTRFRLNSLRAVEKCFGLEDFEHHSFRHEPEPAYFFNSKIIFWAMHTINSLLPRWMKSNLFIFIQKRQL